MEIGKDITQILLPGLDEENCISVDDAKQLLEQAEFNLEAIGVTENEGESLTDMLAEMDSFLRYFTMKIRISLNVRPSLSNKRLRNQQFPSHKVNKVPKR